MTIVDENSILSGRNCAACLMSLFILGSVLLFHDYPGHPHWAELHDAIQHKSLDSVISLDPYLSNVYDGRNLSHINLLPVLFIISGLIFGYRFSHYSQGSYSYMGMRSPPVSTVSNLDCNFRSEYGLYPSWCTSNNQQLPSHVYLTHKQYSSAEIINADRVFTFKLI